MERHGGQVVGLAHVEKSHSGIVPLVQVGDVSMFWSISSDVLAAWYWSPL